MINLTQVLRSLSYVKSYNDKPHVLMSNDVATEFVIFINFCLLLVREVFLITITKKARLHLSEQSLLKCHKMKKKRQVLSNCIMFNKSHQHKAVIIIMPCNSNDTTD